MDFLKSKTSSAKTNKPYLLRASSCRVELHRRGLSDKPGAMALLPIELSTSSNAINSVFINNIETQNSCCATLPLKHENYELDNRPAKSDEANSEKTYITKGISTETHASKTRCADSCESTDCAKTHAGTAGCSGVFWIPKPSSKPCVIEIKLIYKGVFVKKGTEVPDSGIFLRPRGLK